MPERRERREREERGAGAPREGADAHSVETKEGGRAGRLPSPARVETLTSLAERAHAAPEAARSAARGEGAGAGAEKVGKIVPTVDQDTGKIIALSSKSSKIIALSSKSSKSPSKRESGAGATADGGATAAAPEPSEAGKTPASQGPAAKKSSVGNQFLWNGTKGQAKSKPRGAITMLAKALDPVVRQSKIQQ